MDQYKDILSRTQQFLQTQEPLLQIISNSSEPVSVLFEKLTEETDQEHNIVKIAANPELNPLQLLKMFKLNWGLEIDPHARFENQLLLIVEKLNRLGKYGLIFVEKAELLSFSTLAVFSHLSLLQESKPTCLHIILGGKPLLVERMGELLQRQVPQIRIGALTPEQVIEKLKAFTDKLSLTVDEPTVSKVANRIFATAQGEREQTQAMLREITAQDFFPTATHEQGEPQSNPKSEPPEDRPPSHAIATNWQQYWRAHGIRTLAISGLAMMGLILGSHQYHMQHETASFHPLAIHQEKKEHDSTTALSPVTAQAKAPAAATQVQASLPSEPRYPAIINKTPEHAKKAAHSNHYTVQLASSSNKKALLKLANHWHINKKSHILHHHRHHHDWYALTYGNFKTKQSANRVAHQLKPLLKHYRHRPWVTQL